MKKITHLILHVLGLQTCSPSNRKQKLPFHARRQSAGIALAMFLGFLYNQKALAQADNCATATVITCGTSLTGQTNVGATNDAFPACGTGLAAGAPNVWYTFVGNGNSVTVSTCTNTAFDSEIGIFSGSCGSLVCVAGVDADGCGSSDETATFTSVVGTNYFIMIQGHGSATGTFTLDVACVPPLTNDACANATVVTCGTSLNGQTNVTATNDAFPACGAGLATGAPNVWYTFVGNGNSVTVSTCANTAIDSEIGIFSGSCGSLVCVSGTDEDGCGSADETTTFTAVAGTNYFIMIQAHGGATGSFSLDVTCAAPPADPCAVPIETIGCASPKTATLSGAGAGWNPGSCGFDTDGAEKVYSFTPTTTGMHVLQVTSSTGDFVDYFFKDASGGCSSTGWTCIDDNSAAGTDNFGPLTAGTTYYILLDAEDVASVTHTFQINCPAIAIDPCAAPIETIGCASPKTATLSDAGAGWNPGGCGFTTPGAEKVYSFTATVTGTYVLQVTSSTGDFVDYFFKDASGGCSSAGWTCIDDNSAAGTDNFGPLTAGTTYYILLDAEGTGSVTHTFQINCPPPPPANDACTSATVVTCGTSLTGQTNAGATNDAFPTCGAGLTASAPNVWYTFVGNGNLVTVSTCINTAFDSEIGIFSGSCGSLVCVSATDADGCGTNDETAAFTAVAGTNYFIMIQGNVGETGTFSLNVTCVAPPANDACANATPIACGGTASGSTAAATLDGPATSCTGGNVGPDVWYTVTGTGNDITASLCGSGYNSKIDVYTGACGALTSVGCNDDFCGTQSQVTWTSTLGTIYHIRVHGINGATGAYTLAVTCAALAPPCVASPTSPTNGQANMCPSATTTLSWPASVGATSYDVYFGTTNPPPFVSNTTSTSIAESTPTAGTYFWQIRPVGPGGTAAGCTVWSFTKVDGSFTLPTNGASAVACPALIVQPTPPTVTTNCGTTVTPTGPVITNAPDPITCGGTRTFVWTYNNGFGQISMWSHVVTVERSPFLISTPPGSATVSCPAGADVIPTPPTVTSNCGEPITPVRTASPANACEGDRVYTFTYTDCEGNSAAWLFTYHVVYQDFVVPTSIVGTVNCPSEVFQPTPPSVLDNCGNAITPVGPTVSTADNANGCETSRSYSWTYTDCSGNTHGWSQTFLVDYDGDFIAPLDEENYVACLAYAVAPFPQVLFDGCGQQMVVSAPVIEESISPTGCSGVRRFTFAYSDCAGNTHPWSFTYYINDDQGPLGTCPVQFEPGGSGGTVTVDVPDLACIEDVPCPDDYDFTSKVEELLAAGGYFDVCDGITVNAALDSWTDLWQCEDPDDDGVHTFGRTFYFRIADHCGNEYPSLCSVTYSGLCQPLATFPQTAWGIAGGTPGTSVGLTDLQLIGSLLSPANPVVVGGSGRSLTVNDAQCVVDLLPGGSAPGPLANCHQTNCTGCNPMGIGGMKNPLAANAVALTLNMRYNVLQNELTMAAVRSQGLGCMGTSPNITACSSATAGGCRLRVFEQSGAEHQFPHTLGGLLDLANLFLNGGLQLSIGQQQQYASAINQALTDANARWNEGRVDVECPDGSGVAPDGNDAAAKALPTTSNTINGLMTLAPNPASNSVTLTLALDAPAQVRLDVRNQLGQLVMGRDLGTASYINERLDFGKLGSGLYLVSVKVGDQRFEQKLVISK